MTSIQLKSVLWAAGCCLTLFACGPNGAIGFDQQALRTPVDPNRELIITNLSVVEDPVRTAYGPKGVWSFGRLMSAVAGGRDPSDLVMGLFTQWERDQVVNGFTAPARPNIRSVLLIPWLTASGCATTATSCRLDFSKAPFRLLAITNRIDKRSTSNTNLDAGEGRFVFNAVNATTGAGLAFTLILEYKLQARNPQDVLLWAAGWHSLGTMPFGEAYNSRLQLITEMFAGAGIAPGRNNGSALKSLRTNEASLAAVDSDLSNTPTKLWEMRSFHVNSAGRLEQEPVSQNPALAYNGSPYIANWLNQHAASVLDGTYVLPPEILDAAAPTRADLVWTAPGVSPAVTQQFAINTCSGCHRSATNGTAFLHIGRRSAGVQAVLSDWLANVDLPRRTQDFTTLLTEAEKDLEDASKNSEKDKESRGH